MTDKSSVPLSHTFCAVAGTEEVFAEKRPSLGDNVNDVSDSAPMDSYRLQSSVELSPEARAQLRLQRKQELFEKTVRSIKAGPKCLLDVCYESAYTSSTEWKSLRKQIAHMYGYNARSALPFHFGVMGIIDGNEVDKCISTLPWDKWYCPRFSEAEVQDGESSLRKEWLNDAVYLSPDGDNLLESVDVTKTYIIGGIVDRTPSSKISYTRAKALGIPSFRLPINEHIQCTKKLLTMVAVIEILRDVALGGAWIDAFQTHISARNILRLAPRNPMADSQKQFFREQQRKKRMLEAASEKTKKKKEADEEKEEEGLV